MLCAQLSAALSAIHISFYQLISATQAGSILITKKVYGSSLSLSVIITTQLDGDYCEGQGDRKTKEGRQTLTERIEDENRKGFLRTFKLRRWLVWGDSQVQVPCRVQE
jgi:hypothetical protein